MSALYLLGALALALVLIDCGLLAVFASNERKRKHSRVTRGEGAQV